MAHHERHYEWDAWVRQIQTAVPVGPWIERQASTRNAPGDRWDRGVGYDGALRLLTQGWPEGTAEIRRLDALAAVSNEARQNRLAVSVQGFRPLVPLYLSGAPACMLTVNPQYRQGRTVSIGVNVCYNYDTTSEECYRYGTAVLSAIDTLESQGVRVELDVIEEASGSHGGADLQTTVFRIKDASQSLDLDRLAFVLCHSAFLRRLCFRECERHPELFASFGATYGHAHAYAGTDYDVVVPPVGDVATASVDEALDAVATLVATQLGGE